MKGYTSKRELNITMGKKYPVKIDYNQGWACKKYRNKEEMKTQEDYPATERLW